MEVDPRLAVFMVSESCQRHLHKRPLLRCYPRLALGHAHGFIVLLHGCIHAAEACLVSAWRFSTPLVMADRRDCDQCAICRLHAESSGLAPVVIWENCHGLLRHHPLPAPLVGWCLLDAKRHLEGPIDFTDLEAVEWGRVVQRASSLVKQVSGCDRVYAMAFGEGARHLHLHLIPRHAADGRTAAWAVADLYRHVERGDQRPADRAAVEDFLRRARHRASSVLS